MIMKKTFQNPVTLWLYTCCGMIFIMALIGAITRLTESGLSITHWDPIAGALPPLNAEAWNRAFADYQTIPQYRLLNHDMSLDDYKFIYFWEWFHRLWGRLIGLVLIIPLLGFFAAKKISRDFFLKLAVIFALGGLQGFIGWFMVQSGLETRTSVSPYRLALHLGFALLLYAMLLWVALSTTSSFRTSAPQASADPESSLHAHAQRAFEKIMPMQLHGWLSLGMLAITITWGAFVAGMRAGFAYNTWPLMDGSVLPPEAWSLQPLSANILGNMALVQFTHRWLGPATLVMILAWATRCWPSTSTRQKKWLAALAGMALAQVALGIATLLSHVEIAVAVAHQAGAMTLLTLLLINLRMFGETTRRHK